MITLDTKRLKSIKFVESDYDSFIEHWNTISLVGSSGKLLSEPSGPEIDANREVCRFNSAPVNGYHTEVGQKTTFRICNVHSILTPLNPKRADSMRKRFKNFDEHYLKKLQNQKIIFKNPKHTIPLPEKEYRPLIEEVAKNNNKIFFITTEADQYMRAVLRGREPSAGFVGLMFALRYFTKIDCFGFTFNDNTKYPKYYYRPAEENSTGNCHEFTIEQKIFKALEKKGIINIK